MRQEVVQEFGQKSLTCKKAMYKLIITNHFENSKNFKSHNNNYLFRCLVSNSYKFWLHKKILFFQNY